MSVLFNSCPHAGPNAKMLSAPIFPLEIRLKMKQIATMALGRRPHSLFYFKPARQWVSKPHL
jgi:hypothetical protein